MSNRRKLPWERREQAYRNAGSGPALRVNPDGTMRRGEGRNNFPYPRAGSGMRPSLIHFGTKPEEPDYAALTRDQLRAVAKERGLTGYGKMNKAQLIEAVTR